MYRIGDEVAVLSGSEVRQLVRIVHVGPAVVELETGELFFVDDGHAMRDITHIEPARDEHRAGLTSPQPA